MDAAKLAKHCRIGQDLYFKQQKSPSSPMGRKTRDSHPISPLRHRIGLFKSKQTLIL